MGEVLDIVIHNKENGHGRRGSGQIWTSTGCVVAFQIFKLYPLRQHPNTGNPQIGQIVAPDAEEQKYARRGLLVNMDVITAVMIKTAPLR
jgi:hypothetical protein